LDDAPIPPELNRALAYKAWGGGDVFQLPAGLIKKMNVCLNYYHSLQGYLRAAKQTNTDDWIKKNPDAWNLASWVLAQRRKDWGEDGNSTE
jgi:hypothetical protein